MLQTTQNQSNIIEKQSGVIWLYYLCDLVRQKLTKISRTPFIIKINMCVWKKNEKCEWYTIFLDLWNYTVSLGLYIFTHVCFIFNIIGSIPINVNLGDKDPMASYNHILWRIFFSNILGLMLCLQQRVNIVLQY